MTTPSQDFQFKILQRCKSSEDFAVYRAALEWGLTDPIVIEDRKDFKSEYRWHEKLEPFHHQVQNLITFCRRLPVTLLADDVGLGKTISAGLVASELIARGRITKMLIVAPKLLGPQWKDELSSKFSIPAEVVTGSGLIDAEPEGVGAVITTYHSARAHLDKIPDDRFDMLVLDEAHKLRNLYGVDPPPQVAKTFQRALKARRFRYVLMLTATPIQNRLWDLYSLVDLLTVARGHANPFGSEGVFARRFIADDRETARTLKTESREDFRKIVYSYMSRVRRGDANLDFPSREVQLHRVVPTAPELELIATIAKPIQKLNRLAQVGILQALTSSPHALMAQLNGMAERGTVPPELAADVRAIVTPMKTSAKLIGLGQLVTQLKAENPSGWRMVVFTGRRETQTTIEAFLEDLGLKVGIINGSSGQRNQETIARFRVDPPEIRAIVSTEAGSEGINLQVANVLINFDLPWNPMIVEQRIGRVQRLGSNHAKVSILNITLAGTFEEYIVGRLMEKLQMATHAIGDIESLLEASGVGESEDGGGFDERIRELVIAALAGKDMKAAAEKIAKSIDEARNTLAQEKENIDATLGGMDGYEYVGPRAPSLSPPVRSMEFEFFTRAAFRGLGSEVIDEAPGVLCLETNNRREYARMQEKVEPRFSSAPLYIPGSAPFLRLVDRVTASAIHRVKDADDCDLRRSVEKMACDWIEGFGGKNPRVEIAEVRRCFEGSATVRIRATVAHDSYERLVDVPCDPVEHSQNVGLDGLSGLPDLIQDERVVGLNATAIVEAARRDPDIAEFMRFYLERREQEMRSAGVDTRKQKKLEDEFTPRIDATLAALQGEVHRVVRVRAHYRIDGSDYASGIYLLPRQQRVVEEPKRARCNLTGLEVPAECLDECAISGTQVLKHRLVVSEVSGRRAQPEHSFLCSLSGKRILVDEAEMSDLTNAVVDRRLLKTCVISGKKAEPFFIDSCAFTKVAILKEHLVVSEVSGKLYRDDQATQSVVSGKMGHLSEFIHCHETRLPLLVDEAERCASSGKLTRPGVLEACAETAKRVLPSELERCSVTGKRLLRNFLVSSSLSETRFFEAAGVRSAYGKYCAPFEAKRCQWSGTTVHPEDIRTCSLLGLSVHFQYLSDEEQKLEIVQQMLDGTRRSTDGGEHWEDIRLKATGAVDGGKCTVEAAEYSPDGKNLAVCAEVKSLMGFRVRHAGMLYSLEKSAIIGRVAVGKREAKVGWR